MAVKYYKVDNTCEKRIDIAKVRIQLPPASIALTKYFLEAQDNLGYIRVLDAKVAVVNVITTIEQKEELQEFMHSLQSAGMPLVFL